MLLTRFRFRCLFFGFDFDFRFVFAFRFRKFAFRSKAAKAFADDFISNDSGVVDNNRNRVKKVPFHHIFLFGKFAEIVLFCIKIPLMFVKDKKKIKRNKNLNTHTPVMKKIIDLCQIKHISVNFISKSKIVFFSGAPNHSMVYLYILCAA